MRDNKVDALMAELHAIDFDEFQQGRRGHRHRLESETGGGRPYTCAGSGERQRHIRPARRERKSRLELNVVCRGMVEKQEVTQNVSAVSDAPRSGVVGRFGRRAGRVRYGCLKETAGEDLRDRSGKLRSYSVEFFIWFIITGVREAQSELNQRCRGSFRQTSQEQTRPSRPRWECRTVLCLQHRLRPSPEAARRTTCGPLGTEREAACQQRSLEWPAGDRFQDRWLLPALYVVQDGQPFLSEAKRKTLDWPESLVRLFQCRLVPRDSREKPEQPERMRSALFGSWIAEACW
jgi:hypothetical protein